jgi:hypothetical protein
MLSDRPERTPDQPAPGTIQSARPESARTGPGEQIPASLKAALGPETAKVPEVRQPVAQADIASPPVEDEPALEFAFSWFNVDKRLSVLAMLPPDADCLNAACSQMLQRILVALSPELKDAVGREHTFHWPFQGDLGLPTGQRAARQAVDGFVARRLREQPSALLLILADDTPPFLYGGAAVNGDDSNGGLLMHSQFGFAMLRTHSLHAMQTNSELKRSAWQAMQLVRDRLNRGAG